MKRPTIVLVLAMLIVGGWWILHRAGVGRPPVPLTPGTADARLATPPSPASGTPASAVPLMSNGSPAAPNPLTLASPTNAALPLTPIERMVAEARELARRDLPPDAQGNARRVRLVKADFKYPLLRVEETFPRLPQGGFHPRPSLRVAVADHLIVKVRPEAEAGLASAVARVGAVIRQKMSAAHLYLVAFPNPTLDTVPEGMAALLSLSNVVDYAEPDGIAQALATFPNDPSFGELWGLHNTGQTVNWGMAGTPDADIDAPEAWDIETGSTNVVVAVIDTGINYHHPDLTANLWRNPGETPGNGVDDEGNGLVDDVYGWDFHNFDNDPMDDYTDVYHGTHCAGTLGAAANNSTGVVGVTWKVRLMALKALNNLGRGATSDLVNAIAYATRMRVRLTSNSWGGIPYSQAMVDAIAEAAQANILFVAAAGNDGVDTDANPHYPSSFTNSNIISVANSNNRDLRQSSSNYGLLSVDLAAPGHNIYSCSSGADYQFLNGTSMATPQVAGVCALLWSHNPLLPAPSVKQTVLDSVDANSDFAGQCVTGGRLNAWRALTNLAFDVVATVPALEETVLTAPTQFQVTFTDPCTPGSVAASDLTVNGVPADQFALSSSNTVTFSFNTSPVTVEGAQTLAIAADAISRLRDGRGIAPWTGTVRYDPTPLSVISTVPASGGTLILPTAAITLTFNEAFDTNSVSVSDLVLSPGAVLDVTVLNSNSLSFTVTNGPAEDTVTAHLPAGALTDLQGNPSLDFAATFRWDFVSTALPVALNARTPLASLVYDARLEAAIHDPGDSDTFTLALNSGQQLAVAVQCASGSLQPSLEVRDPANTLLTNLTASAPGQSLATQPLPVAAAGNYSIRISGAGASTGDYTLRPALNAALELESYGGSGNDSRDAAQDLDPGARTYTNAIAALAVLGFGANDWYAVTLASNDVVTVGVAASSGGAPSVSLFDPAGALLARGVAGWSNLSQFIDRVRIGETATYSLQVTGSTGDYNLVLTRNACLETEPHDTRAGAQPISGSQGAFGHLHAIPSLTAEIEPNDDGAKNASPGDLALANDLTGSFVLVSNQTWRATVTGLISAGGDLDWDFFKFRAAPGDTVELRLNRTDADSDPYLRLFSRTATELASNDDGGGWPNSLVTHSAFSYSGEYFVCADNWGGSSGAYELVVQITTPNLQRTSAEDHYAVEAAAGDTLSVFTLTPGEGTALPGNALDPRLEVFDSGGTLVATNDNGAPDGRNARLTYRVPAGGTYTLRVTPAGITSGEYLLGVTGATGALPDFHVASSTPAQGALLKTTPTQMTVQFKHPVRFTTLQPSDLKIDGVSCPGFDIGDGGTVMFTLPPLANGQHTATLAAGAVLDTLNSPVAAFAASFATDTQAPRVTASSLTNNASMPAGNLTCTATFSEPLVAGQVTAAALRLVGAVNGTNTPADVSYSSTSSNSTLTLTFNALPEDSWTLTLRSGDGLLEDPAGNHLDGEYSGLLPSGNGTEGGDFVVHFYTQFPAVALPAFTAREPLGSLAYGTTASGYSGPSGDQDVYSVALDAGQTLTLLVQPASGFQPIVRLDGPGGTLAELTSPSPGETLVLQTQPITGGGDYAIRVSGANHTTGGFTLEAWLNAAVETESLGGASNDTVAAAQNLDAALVALPGAASRAAVWGAGDAPGPDGFGYRAVSVPYQFQDISGSGYSEFSSTDDGSVTLPSDHPYLNGFTFNFYGTVRTTFGLTPNGLLTFGGGYSSGANTDLTTTPSYAGVAAFWDDLHTRSAGRVYYQVFGSGNSQQLVVQWNNVEFKNDSSHQGTITFQAVLNEADGTLQFNYPDLASGFVPGNEGAGATVGIKNDNTQGSQRLMVSLNSTNGPYVGSGRSLKIGTNVASGTGFDHYVFTLTAGDRLTLAAHAAEGNTNLTLQLLNSAGTVLASGQAFANVQQAVLNYSIPASGLYCAKVRGPAGGHYVLTVLRNAAFDAEANDTFASAQDLDGCPAALGWLPGTANSDYFGFHAIAGQTVFASTSTPADGSGECSNTLDPALELYSPAGALVASDANGAADGRNAWLSAVAGSSGRYVARVLAQSGSGEYALRAFASSVSTVPTNLTATVIGGAALDLSWPASHTGWELQTQTNSLAAGLGTNWVTVAGSATTNRVLVPLAPGTPAVFFRLRWP
jgi:subtilisin family serine protease